jgi:predicted transcriptional regulator
MCFETLLMVGMNVAGGLMTASGAQTAGKGAYMEAAYKKHGAEVERIATSYQLDILDQQLAEEVKSISIRATQAAAQRTAEANQIHVANVMHIAGSGVGENLSYEQGIREENRRNMESDLNTIGMEATGQALRVVDQIRVNKMERIFNQVRTDNIGKLADINAHYTAKAYQTQAATSIMTNFAMPTMKTLSGGGLQRDIAKLFGG